MKNLQECERTTPSQLRHNIATVPRRHEGRGHDTLPSLPPLALGLGGPALARVGQGMDCCRDPSPLPPRSPGSGFPNPVKMIFVHNFVHEFVHVVQGSFFHFQNGKRRPHDYTFNLMMCKVAKSFFGYPFNPYQAGFSIGKGYAPTRHLSEWLKGEIGKENPKVMKWFNN